MANQESKEMLDTIMPIAPVFVWTRFWMLLLLTSPPCSCSSDFNSMSKYFTRPRARAGPGRLEVRRSMLTDASTASGLCDSIIKAAGYPCEEITVQTSDGFLLGLQHIPHGPVGSHRKQKRPPVFLQHGLSQGGENWVLNSPAQSLAYILADHGFDVWIGNLRGTRFSHGHRTLSPNKAKFWNWSFNEHATIDLPTMVGYVHKATASEVYYVGHSQGTIMMLAAMSQDAATGMAEMVKAAVLLAPIAYLQHTKSQLLSISAALMLDTIVGLFGTREFNLKNKVGENLTNTACAEPNVFCDDLLNAYTGPNCCFNSSRVAYYLEWGPQSTSTKNLQHLAQMMRVGRFQNFDHGFMENFVRYKQAIPPLYELAKIPPSTNLFMISGGRDAIADSSDVKRLENELRCRVHSLILPSYGHADFVVGTKANVDVYNPIIQYFQALD